MDSVVTTGPLGKTGQKGDLQSTSKYTSNLFHMVLNDSRGNPHMVNDDLSEELDHLANGGSTKTYQPPAVDPPHRKDGYVRKHLNNLVPFQLSRYDSAVSRNGRTVAFRRSSV
mmetsp:Transcript_26044/g.61284  ORF Transcript_26044/g.61284 Transcript_26044/m.61284 type:complete len:113 (+) Transcript_26044:590-928(+)